MKQLLLFVFLAPIFSIAQNHQRCGQGKHMAEFYANNEEARIEREDLERFTAEFTSTESRADIIIPVVFHVNDPINPGKVTVAQVESAIDILNEDFNADNPDYGSVRPEFMNTRADIGIQFCLATKDPSGSSTTGITYHNNSYNGREPGGNGGSVKAVSNWPNDQYLNIWIVNETENDGSIYNSGWAFLPSNYWANNDLDGIVFNHQFLGYGEGSSQVSGVNSWQAEMARVLTHEVGHYLNVYHTFENYCSAPGDYCDDTPAVYYHGSNNCEQLGEKCSGVTVVNDENYMDYSVCSRMFSENQKTRMLAAVNSSVASRNNLWTAGNLQATGCNPSSTGIEENEFTGSMSVYPNPIEGELTLNYVGVNAGYYSFSVSDLLGRTGLIQSKVVLSESGTHHLSIPENLKAGIYILNIENEIGLAKRIKLIKK